MSALPTFLYRIKKVGTSDMELVPTSEPSLTFLLHPLSICVMLILEAYTFRKEKVIYL